MEQSIVLLTYKGKVLLVSKDYVLPSSDPTPWHFIFGAKKEHESGEDSVCRMVKKETSIQLDAVEYLGSMQENDEKRFFFHASLTDDNVNNIVRRDGEVVGFFSVKELTGLSLSLFTKQLIGMHADILGNATALEKKGY